MGIGLRHTNKPRLSISTLLFIRLFQIVEFQHKFKILIKVQYILKKEKKHFIFMA